MYNFNQGNFNRRNNGPFGSSGYQYQTLPNVYEGTQAGGLVGKVMLLLAFSFLVACIGSFIGLNLVHTIGFATFWIAAIGGLVVLLILRFTIQVSGLNLVLLYLFTFLEGMSLAPIIAAYLTIGYGYILGEAFLITAITSLVLAVYAWTTKRNFSRLALHFSTCSSISWNYLLSCREVGTGDELDGDSTGITTISVLFSYKERTRPVQLSKYLVLSACTAMKAREKHNGNASKSVSCR